MKQIRVIDGIVPSDVVVLIGDSIKFTCPSCQTDPATPVHWSSHDPSVLAVGVNTGIVTARSVGVVQVTAHGHSTARTSVLI